MKNSIKNTLLVLLLITAFGCGKDNKANSSGSSSTIFNRNNVAIKNTPNDVSKLFNQLSSALPCRTGKRLSNVSQYSLQGSTSQYNSSQNRLAGQFNPGTINGSVGQLFMGTSTFNDLMIIAEMTNGNQVVGHNVYISMCEAQGLIFEGRTLSGFQAPNGIVLDKNTNCPYGVIDAAINTYLQADAYQSQYGQMYPAAVWTTFYNIQCN